jgi:hypothetical protein
MKNLKGPEKKLIFSIGVHFLVIVLIAFGIIFSVKTLDIRENYYRESKDSIISEYNAKIKERDAINQKLILKQQMLEEKIDSLEQVKGIININYDKKIKNIYDASAIEHVMWLDSTLKKVNNIKRK